MSHILPLTAAEVERRLFKVDDLAIHTAVASGDFIHVAIDHFIEQGSSIKFKAPVDCSAITRLQVHYSNAGETVLKTFAFADANGNDVGEINNLFAEGSIVKVILDLDADIDGQGTGAAFVQNADTNAYLESKFLNITDIDYDSMLAFDTSEIVFNTNVTSVLGQAILGQMILA